ncbi:leucine rich repeat protein [Aspergillus luchuensis]|uniref:Leucine rich repeat protein n=1 Tax=Aspergillus kawachii TaxID=1069201 RepID=A0A146FC14_ASPKA|nr:leucine rich repeat protein [Aspergillus luchuensis]
MRQEDRRRAACFCAQVRAHRLSHVDEHRSGKAKKERKKLSKRMNSIFVVSVADPPAASRVYRPLLSPNADSVSPLNLPLSPRSSPTPYRLSWVLPLSHE